MHENKVKEKVLPENVFCCCLVMVACNCENHLLSPSQKLLNDSNESQQHKDFASLFFFSSFAFIDSMYMAKETICHHRLGIAWIPIFKKYHLIYITFTDLRLACSAHRAHTMEHAKMEKVGHNRHPLFTHKVFARVRVCVLVCCQMTTYGFPLKWG